VNRLGKHEQDLVAALVFAFPDYDALAEFAYSAFGLNLQELSNGNLNQATGALIRWALVQQRERDLLMAAASARQDCAPLLITIGNCKQHLDQVAPTPWYRSPEPVDACIVRGKYALFDRDGLRRSLKELLADDGPNVLIVRGERGSGCSHSLQLIVHMAAELGTFKLVYVDLENLGRDIAPDELIRHMAYALICAVDSIPAEHGQAARWNLDLGAWFTAQVDSRDQQTWVVVDGMDHSRPREETVELLKRLAVMAETSTQRLRIVFLGCEELLPSVNEADSLHESIEALGDETLDEFFTQFFQHRQVRADAEAVQLAASRVRELAGDEPEGRLRRLSEFAFRVARQLAEPPKAA
jgi:hypothetical protein